MQATSDDTVITAAFDPETSFQAQRNRRQASAQPNVKACLEAMLQHVMLQSCDNCRKQAMNTGYVKNTAAAADVGYS
jgi:hypothetical protein